MTPTPIGIHPLQRCVVIDGDQHVIYDGYDHDKAYMAYSNALATLIQRGCAVSVARDMVTFERK